MGALLGPWFLGVFLWFGARRAGAEGGSAHVGALDALPVAGGDGEGRGACVAAVGAIVAGGGGRAGGGRGECGGAVGADAVVANADLRAAWLGLGVLLGGGDGALDEGAERVGGQLGERGGEDGGGAHGQHGGEKGGAEMHCGGGLVVALPWEWLLGW